jgi:hypothetical protein
MADNDTAGTPPTGNSPPSDDLRSLIAGITTESKKEGPTEPPAGGSGEASPPAAPGATGEPARPTPERGRGGRFVAAGEPPPSEPEPERKEPLRPPPEPGSEPPGEGDKGPVPPKEASQPAAGERRDGAKETAAPEHWSAGDKAMFNAWQPAMRDQFLTMYKRMEGGFTQRLQRGAELERGFGEIEQLFQPYGEMLRQRNQTPKDIIKTWHEVERNLSLPTEQNLVIAKMIHNYQADPAQIARYLNQLRGFADPGAGGQPPPPRVGNGTDPTTGIHPALAARLDALETDRTQRIQADNDARLGDAHRQINEFANAKDADGNLAHPFYAELEGEMMQLAYADRAAGRTPVIADLYDRAAWANPVVRDKLLASQREAEDRAQAAARKAKAEAAARAGSSVTGAPSSGQVPNSAASDRSIRDEIRAHMTGNGSGRV